MSATTLESIDDARRLLAQFLRSRREAVSADAARGEGLGRRRTPGLRREEVAQRAGISTTWYTWMEQGREVALSAAALARLAEALALTAAERAYLFELARRRDPAPPAAIAMPELAPELLSAVAAMPMPAYLLDRWWCRRAWNGLAATLFEAWRDEDDTCLLRFVFLHPAARSLISDWDERAQRLVAEFRADTALYPEDVVLRDKVACLRRESPEFARHWEAQAVLAREGGRRRFSHPSLGSLTYTQVTLLPAGHADCKLVLLLPEGGGDHLFTKE
ncbi:transcriptional regulator [Dyella solisilvae]|uniref:Transcriptional regulator n=1 Tax=Dyella solisilvae TaxID=1920168 RepID=A0A370K3N7_9GAMM|nr:helix-turn-helix transcriptional regulator [Dyella solisilvae]RDI97239.1 transcriptional regulator [Dyella solisilvae]